MQRHWNQCEHSHDWRKHAGNTLIAPMHLLAELHPLHLCTYWRKHAGNTLIAPICNGPRILNTAGIPLHNCVHASCTIVCMPGRATFAFIPSTHPPSHSALFHPHSRPPLSPPLTCRTGRAPPGAPARRRSGGAAAAPAAGCAGQSPPSVCAARPCAGLNPAPAPPLCP